MADLKAKDVEERYDQLVQDIIEQLKRVLNDLKSVKANEKMVRGEIVRGTYFSKSRLIAETKRGSGLSFGSREALNAHAAHTRAPGPLGAYYFEQIKPLEKEFQELVKEKIEIDRNDYRTFLQDQQRVNGDIKKIEALLKYIQENTGNKKNRRALNTKAMYDQIKAVYTDGINIRKESEITQRHQELKRKIEQKADQILRELNNLIAGGPR